MGEMLEMSGTTESGDPKKVKSGSNRVVRSIKTIIGVLCVFGLIYQVTTLILQYLEYKTVVNVSFETIKYNRLPAITICYPRFVAMNKTAERFPHLKAVFKEYKNALRNVSDSDYQNKTFRNYLNNIYEEKFEQFIANQNLTISQLYDLSIDFSFPLNSSAFVAKRSDRPIEVPVEVNVIGLRRYDDGEIELFSFADTQPIESVIVPVLSQRSKCFTFNSHLNPQIRQYQMDIKLILVKVSQPMR